MGTAVDGIAAKMSMKKTSLIKYGKRSNKSLSYIEKYLITKPIGKISTTILKICFNSGHMGKGNKKGHISAKSPIHINHEPKVIPNILKNFFKTLPPISNYIYILTALSPKGNCFFAFIYLSEFTY